MLVSKIMQTKLVLATMECSFKNLLCKIANLAPRQIYVVNDKLQLQGIITGYDLLKVVLPEYMDSNLLRSVADEQIDDFLLKNIERVKDKKASEIMITDFVYLKPTDHAMEAEALVVEKRINALPVLDTDKRLLGEVNRRDILNYMARLVCDFEREEFEHVDVRYLLAGAFLK
ncbi:CBS domain-containing protein [Desulfovulcanus sp.]